MGDRVDGLIVLFDLEHVSLHHLWKPGQFYLFIYFSTDIDNTSNTNKNNKMPA